VLAAITYSGIPWEAAAGFPLDVSRSYLSELAAADRPYGAVFRALDGATGALVLAALALCVVARRRAGRPTTRVERGSGFALAAFAALTVLDASSPMVCATSTSAACAAADAANALGLSHQIHTVSSATALAAVIVSAVLLAVDLARGPGRGRPGERRVVFVLAGMLIVVTALVTALAAMSTGDGKLIDGGGFVQRAQVVLVSAYLVGFGVVVTRLRSGVGRERPGPEGVR